ncbi:hypothetical protein SAMN04488044_0855 [Cognatishimia maritima]|uniref:Uncharacterized protein n=1 Tax=Cognatishimia maritima TaxID=870908 RepID=A0A1M5K2T6_9RHOB|nr:hypothetical protein SAMN04488044_0855 [Cognatishimia maritima]
MESPNSRSQLGITLYLLSTIFPDACFRYRRELPYPLVIWGVATLCLQ